MDSLLSGLYFSSICGPYPLNLISILEKKKKEVRNDFKWRSNEELVVIWE